MERAIILPVQPIYHNTSGELYMSREDISANSIPKLIGFCGYATVGKNTAAEELNKLLKSSGIEYKLVGFADSLKRDLINCINFCQSDGVNTSLGEFKEEFRPMWVLWSKIAKLVTKNKLIWVKRLFQYLTHYPESHVAICDVRYTYEIEEILRRGGIVFYITRDGCLAKNEEERESFSDIMRDYPKLKSVALANNGTKEELGEEVFKRIVR